MLALLAAVVAGVLVLRGGGDAHTVRAAFASAVQVVPGQDVRIAGRKVGKITKVALTGGEVVLTLQVDDGPHWPLRRGTVARLRFGLPASYASRYVDITPGPADQPALRDGGILTTADTITPVEFDQMYRIFGPRTRENLKALLDNAAGTLDGHAGDLRRAFTRGSRGLRSVSGVARELGEDRAALHTLVTAVAQTSDELARHENGLRGLIDNTGATFDELQDNASAVQESLDRFPDALRSGRRTLARTDRSLVGLQGLVDDLRPGAAGLGEISPTVRRGLSTQRRVAPRLETSLRTGRRSLPAITRFVSEATPFLPQLSGVLKRLGPMLGCVRPYAPEIAGFLGTWLSFTANFDNVGRYARGSQRMTTINPGTHNNTVQTLAEHPPGALTYAMPRPPGMNAGKPWLLPQCGITKDALDPSKDPETRR
jgi:virulence factor Mce-like protein